MSMTLMTFGEFIEKWNTNHRLIGPHDYETRDHCEIGIIGGRHWCPVSFSPALEHLTGAFVRAQIVERARARSIQLTEDQIRLSRKGVENWICSRINESIDTALDELELDREIVVLDAWAVPGTDIEYGDVYTDPETAVKESGLPIDQLIHGYTLSGGDDIREFVEDKFDDFYTDKEEISQILVENNVVHLVNDLSNF
ncbi:hypothetical protein SAMN02799624_05340 [Paenibacillus sp. UNC496MF]|uniref:hypothetical protein n=1 Tax=Paenibacillus sp. UNC496MF TaxID=1502753 RepID=UPI0008F079ED|nr:hypothetical protein [Paenibacillus sp. UNC496MF]SFJ64422.1 hypothetical protein SAMN02799624_05340 [Paenibacillus sp. UNC496MF]